MGMNFGVDGNPSPSIMRENTCQSFLQAARSGATFVEFDVQVTADGVPVIWHDDLVQRQTADGAILSSPVSSLTLAEFQRIYEMGRTGMPLKRRFHSRSGILGKLTDWRCTLDDKLPTLAEVFAAVPEQIGFDIEVKMAVPDTVAQTSATEVDRCIGPILECLSYTRSSHRQIMFSSFDPEVCRALRDRQNSVAVYLLFCGLTWHIDERRTSTAAAIDFALHHQLKGIVMETRTLRTRPGTAAAAHRQGLQLVTYGLDNNDPFWVMHQHLRLGICGVIVDDVAIVASYVHTFASVPRLCVADVDVQPYVNMPMALDRALSLEHRQRALARVTAM